MKRTKTEQNAPKYGPKWDKIRESVDQRLKLDQNGTKIVPKSANIDKILLNIINV